MRLFAKIRRTGVVTEPLSLEGLETITVARVLDDRTKALLRGAVAIRHIDAGSCNGCEFEIAELSGPVYDLERFGLPFVASPRHADLQLVAGQVTRNMVLPSRTFPSATSRSTSRTRATICRPRRPMVACLAPALRAAGTDPLSVLRAD